MIPIVAAIAASVAVGVGSERRWGEGAQTAARRTLTAMLFGLVPIVAFFNVARLEVTVDIGVGIVLGWAALLLAGGFTWLGATRLLALPRPSTGASICAVIQANTGYLGYPLCVAALGADRLPEAVAYDLLVQAPILFLVGFGTGAAFGTRAGDGARDRVRAFFLRNPPLAAVALAVIVPDALAPDALVDLSRLLVAALLPLGFFAVGVTLAAERRATTRAARGPVPADGDAHAAGPRRLSGPVALVLLARLVVAPGLLLGLALPLIDLPGPYLLLASMPCGINSLVIANAYGLDKRLTSAAIAASTVVVVAVALVVLSLT